MTSLLVRSPWETQLQEYRSRWTHVRYKMGERDAGSDRVEIQILTMAVYCVAVVNSSGVIMVHDELFIILYFNYHLFC